MLDLKPLHPVAALASPAALYDKKRSADIPSDANHEEHEEESEHFVYLNTTWVFASLRHPLWRLATCSLRLLCCFIVCVTSPLVNAHYTPAFFPIYGDLVGIFCTHVTPPKLLFHGALSAVVLALLRLVVYRLWCEDQWNWLRQYTLARQTFTRLSRASSASEIVRHAAATTDRSEADATISLHIYESATNEAPTTRVRVHTAPRAQGSWTLMVLLFPILWWVLVSALRPIVVGTDYEDLLFGHATKVPQWRAQVIVYNVLMTLHTLSWLLTLDSVLQDTWHFSGVWRRLRSAYSTSARGILRILLCWAGLLGIGIGGLYFDGFTVVRTWFLQRWSRQASDAPDSVETLTSEAWRAVLSSLVVVLDLLWLVQDWHFPAFATSVGARMFGFHRDYVAIPLLHKKKKLFLTNQWTRCFIVLGLLLPLDLCNLYQDYTYSPPAYAQIVSISNGYRVFPSPTSITPNNPEIIAQLSKEGSIGRFFLQSRLDRVPALMCVGMMVALVVWLHDREHWRLCYAAFLGQPTRADQALLKAKINASVPKSTRESLKDQMRLFNLYRLRSQYDLLGASLAVVSIGSVIFQVRSIWRATSGAPEIQDAAGETYAVLLLVVSAVMVYQLYYRYALQYEIFVLRKQIPPSSSRLWWRGTPPSLLLVPFFVEVVLSGLCLPPFLHGDVAFDEERYVVLTSRNFKSSGITCPARMTRGGLDDEGNASCDLHYDYPIEVLNLVVLVRLYWLVRLLRNALFRRLFADHAALLVTAGIGGSVPRELSSLRWSLKLCLSLIPGRVILSIFLLLWTGTAAAVSILERPFPSLLDNEEHSLWLTIVTISAVGYGDAYPVTALGRLSIILGAVLGGAVVVSLMTSIFLETLKGSKDEHTFVQELERITYDKTLQHLSATLIAAAWKARRQRLRLGRQSRDSDHDVVFKLAHDFSAARKRHRPKETFESLDQLRIRSIAKWRTTHLRAWTAETKAQRSHVIEMMENEVAALERAMQPLVAGSPSKSPLP